MTGFPAALGHEYASGCRVARSTNGGPEYRRPPSPSEKDSSRYNQLSPRGDFRSEACIFIDQYHLDPPGRK